MDIVLTALATIFIPIFLYWLIKLLRIKFYFSKIPGPPGLPILGNILEFQKSQTELMNDFNARALQYKDDKIYKLWIFTRAVVILFTPKAVEALYTNNVNISKPEVYDNLGDWLGTGLLTSTGEKWRTRRKLITPAFHFQILNDFIHVFCEHAETLIKILKEKVDKEAFNPYPYLTRCTLDIINETAMGIKINAQLDGNSEYVNATKVVGKLIEVRNRKPWEWFTPIFYMLPSGKLVTKNLKILHSFTQKVIEERAEEIRKQPITPDAKPEDAFFGKKKKRAFLDLLLHASEGGKVLSFSDIQEEVDTFMFAGHDTTSAAALFGLYAFGRNLDVQKKAQQEMDELFGSDNRRPTLEDLKNMKYLDCCLKEILRMYPPAAHIGRKITEDMKILDYTIPKGSQAIFDIYSLHHNPDNFPNPEKFDPDRFLPENSAGRHPFAYTPFSAGTRNCIGQRFALMEEKVLMSYFLRNFNIESMQKPEELKIEVLLVLRVENGVFIKLTQRKK